MIASSLPVGVYLATAVLFGGLLVALAGCLVLARMLVRLEGKLARKRFECVRLHGEAARREQRLRDETARRLDLEGDLALLEQTAEDRRRRVALAWLPPSVTSELSEPLIH